MERKIKSYNELFELPVIHVGDTITITNYSETSIIIKIEDTDSGKKVTIRSLNILEKIGRWIKQLLTK